jgi:hypothetical protein
MNYVFEKEVGQYNPKIEKILELILSLPDF